VNILKPNKRYTILTLLEKGLSQREINRKVGVDRKTIRRYSKSSWVATGINEGEIQIPPPRPPDGRASKIPKEARSACEPYKDWIEEQLRLGRNAMAIYQDLVELYGFSHRYNSVKRYVRKIRQKDPEIFDRIECLPGEEAQVDFGKGAPALYKSTGKYRRPWLFVMTLKYSRKSFRAVVWKADQKTWVKLHEQAFRFFGGATQYVVLDNLKQGVLKPDIYDPEINPLYAAMLRHYGSVADPTRVCDPDRKGTVENAIQHTQDTALKGRRFESIDAQNEWLLHWEERWAAQRIHGRMKRQVEEMYKEEKPKLIPLPNMSFRMFEQSRRRVADDCNVQIGNSYYSARPAVPICHCKDI
jgi:transposase